MQLMSQQPDQSENDNYVTISFPSVLEYCWSAFGILYCGVFIILTNIKFSLDDYSMSWTVQFHYYGCFANRILSVFCLRILAVISCIFGILSWFSIVFTYLHARKMQCNLQISRFFPLFLVVSCFTCLFKCLLDILRWTEVGIIWPIQLVFKKNSNKIRNIPRYITETFLLCTRQSKIFFF